MFVDSMMYHPLIVPFFVCTCETRSISTPSRPASLSSPNDGSSMISHSHSTETPFSGADAVIMADTFRKALRKPDFAGRTIE
jgi:hypothetical protein